MLKSFREENDGERDVNMKTLRFSEVWGETNGRNLSSMEKLLRYSTEFLLEIVNEKLGDTQKLFAGQKPTMYKVCEMSLVTTGWLTHEYDILYTAFSIYRYNLHIITNIYDLDMPYLLLINNLT
jgi:hypothetical protein